LLESLEVNLLIIHHCCESSTLNR